MKIAGEMILLALVFHHVYGASFLDKYYRTYSASASGQVLCGDKPIHMATVDLYHENILHYRSLMGSEETNMTGYFHVTGSVRAMMEFHGKVKISIPEGLSNCAGEVVVEVPEQYIQSGMKSAENFWIGNMDVLNGKMFKGIYCYNSTAHSDCLMPI